MAKIIGNTTATPNPRPDWTQTDSTKADYIKNKPEFANVATSGSYNDLTDKPIIMQEVDDNGILYINNTSEFASLGLPIKIYSEAEMDDALNNATSDDVGKIYQYMGETTDKYENGAMYSIEETE